MTPRGPRPSRWILLAIVAGGSGGMTAPRLGPAAALAAQDALRDSAEVEVAGDAPQSPADTIRAGRPSDPPLPIPEKAPVWQYRLGAGASAFAWDEEAAADDGLLAGLDVERDVGALLAIRAGLGYGRTELEPLLVEDAEPLETRLYLPEVSLLLQADVGPLRDGPFVPYAVAGFGALISDPDREGLGTRSQNAFAWGAGARVRIGRRLGARGEFKRYLIELEDAFDAASSDSESTHNTRIGGSLTYAF